MNCIGEIWLWYLARMLSLGSDPTSSPEGGGPVPTRDVRPNAVSLGLSPQQAQRDVTHRRQPVMSLLNVS